MRKENKTASLFDYLVRYWHFYAFLIYSLLFRVIMRVPVWVGVTGVDEPVSVLLAYWEPFHWTESKVKVSLSLFLTPPPSV